MTPFLLLLIFVLWLVYPESEAAQLRSPNLAMGVFAFLGFYVILVGVTALWSRRLARRIGEADLQRKLRAFNLMIQAGQTLIPLWFGVGVYLLGWGELIERILQPTIFGKLHVDLPGLIIGTAPALAAWVGLWWAQYPADRALRERNMLVQLSDDLPIHAPPDLRSFFVMNLRLQLLFTMAPVLALVLLRDVLSVALWRHLEGMSEQQKTLKAILSLAAGAAIFYFAPELLKRILHTEPMPDSPLRRRLESICRQYRIRYNDILLWRTDYHLGNAAVMGFTPRVRYILISDMLLEQLRDEEIEAVFAHEIGHVRHRHLLWFVVIVIIMMLALALPGEWLGRQWDRLAGGSDGWTGLAGEGAALAAGIGLFLLIFGYLSRKFERQADVFAARTLQRQHDADNATDSVGQYGAAIFSSALNRVAAINNIPLTARNWRHGSITTRLNYLNHLTQNPRATADFDRFMFGLYAALIACLCGLGAWMAVAEFGAWLK